MLVPQKSRQFKKDQEKAKKQKKNFDKLHEILRLLIKEQPLPEKYRDHPLTENWKGYRDCHIENDWVLIYKVDAEKQALLLQRLGSHSELFG